MFVFSILRHPVASCPLPSCSHLAVHHVAKHVWLWLNSLETCQCSPWVTFGQAGNAGRMRWHLGSVRAQIRQGTLAAWGRGWGPAENTDRVMSLSGSGKEHLPGGSRLGSGMERSPGGIAVGVWQGTLAVWGCGWGGHSCSMHVPHHSWHFRLSFLDHGAAAKVPAWTQTGKQYRLEEAPLASRFFFQTCHIASTNSFVSTCFRANGFAIQAKRLMIPLTAAQTRDALRWVGWPYKNRGSCACEFLSFPANLGGYNLTPGNPVSTWGCLTFLLALSLQTKRFLGLILAPLFRSGKLYGVPVDAALPSACLRKSFTKPSVDCLVTPLYGDFTDLRRPSTAESISHGVYVALNFASETEETSEVFFYNAFGICDFATFFHLLPKMSICPTVRFTLACHQQRPPRSVFFVGRHYHDSTRGVNFWHTGLNNQAPKVFDVSLFLGASPCLLHAIPDLQLLIGVFASTSSASLLHVPSPDQALPFNMASARFHIRHGTCQTIDAASASSFHPADCQHTIDFHTRRSFTVVCHQQDQTFSLFDSDGERLLSLSCLLLPKDTPIKSFVCLLSPSFSLPSCAVTADVHRRPRVRATQPHLQKGYYAMFHFLPHCTVIGGASLSLESGQRSLPLSFPLPCCCAAVLFDALDYCLLLSGGGDAVELSKHGKPLWCSLHDTSDESDSSAAASPLTTAVHSGAVVSLVDSLDAPDPAPTAEQVAKHQDASVEQVIRLYADVLHSCSIRASFLQSWRDLFQLEDEDLIARCARLHSENMEWRIFFVNGAYRETPMPFSLAQFLLKGMECPAVLLWHLGSHAFHLLTAYRKALACHLWRLSMHCVEFFYSALLRHSGCHSGAWQLLYVQRSWKFFGFCSR